MSVVNQVDLHVAASGNYFMREIAQLFVDGFLDAGIPARIASDELPSNNPNVMSVIVAPHEYYPLFLINKGTKDERNRILQQCYIINTEQPGSYWFELAYYTAQHAKGVFDISQLGVDAFVKRGIPATHVPMGYGKSLEETEGEIDDSRAIDILFLGHGSPRREKFISDYADFFSQKNCQLVFVPVDRPRSIGSVNFWAGARRNALLRSSKILINVHSTERNYFEWHRWVTAAANRCLLVSELSGGVQPLENNKHLAMPKLGQMIETIQHYLDDPQARAKVTDEAYHQLKQNMPMKNSSLKLLEVASTKIESRIRRSVASGFGGRVKHARHIANNLFRGYVIRPVEKLHIPHYVRLVRNRGKFQKLEQRRKAILQVLTEEENQDLHAKYEAVENQASQQTLQPSISVVVTLYNYGQYIKKCVDSVANAETSSIPGGIELIIVDDLSTDDSATIARNCIQSLKIPARLVCKKRNTGLAAARNLGIALARGAYIFTLDADNFIYPSGLAKLYDMIESTDLAAVYGIIARFDNDSGEGTGLISQYGWDVEKLLQAPYIDAMALIRRDALVNVGGYSVELLHHGWFGWEDYDLWLKLAQAGYQCKLSPQVVAAYRSHPTSMIQLTLLYIPNIVSHFNKKFTSLIQASTGKRSRQFGI